MKTLPTLKLGDSFVFTVNLLDSAGQPLAIVSANSQVRDECNNKIADLLMHIDSSVPNRAHFYSDETATWPLVGVDVSSPLIVDVQFTSADGFLSSTEPMSLTTVRGATHA